MQTSFQAFKPAFKAPLKFQGLDITLPNPSGPSSSYSRPIPQIEITPDDKITIGADSSFNFQPIELTTLKQKGIQTTTNIYEELQKDPVYDTKVKNQYRKLRIDFVRFVRTLDMPPKAKESLLKICLDTLRKIETSEHERKRTERFDSRITRLASVIRRIPETDDFTQEHKSLLDEYLAQRCNSFEFDAKTQHFIAKTETPKPIPEHQGF